MPTWNKIFLPDANSPHMEQILFFHDHIMMILTLVLIFVLYMLTSAYKNKFFNKLLLESQMLETIWTAIPSVIIIFIAFPSLSILYLMEENMNPILSLKVTGHQWYWSYTLSNFINMDAFMKTQQTSMNSFRLLETDQRLILPSLTPSLLLVTSSDVIHSWTIPSLGVKTDATPGRLNQITLLPLRPGLYFGQCSEICGTNHSFMPITLEIIPLTMFINWLIK